MPLAGGFTALYPNSTATLAPIEGYDFTSTVPPLLVDYSDFTPQKVALQFNDIQLSLSSNTPDNRLDISSLRAFCQREDVTIFARSLAEYIAGMDHQLTVCNSSTRFLFVVFLCVGIFGFIGNLLTFIVILRTPSLHSQTNFFLASLAFSDLLLILVGVSFDIFFLWRRKAIVVPFNGFCETTSTLISWFTFNSILTIVSLSGERLVAICYPFSLKPWFHRNSVIWLIFILGIISFFPSLYIGLQFTLVIEDFCGRVHKHPGGVGSKCDFMGWGMPQNSDNYTFELMLLLTFVLPVLFVIYCYVKILRTLNEATCNSYHLNATPGNGGNSQQSTQQQILLPVALPELNSPTPEGNGDRAFFSTPTRNSRNSFGQFARDSFVRNSQRSQQAHKTVMTMLIMIAALFFICYLPYHLERLIVKYKKQGGCADVAACSRWLYHGTGLLQYISAALNPIIYNIMSRRFRREFQRICYKIVKKELKPEMRCRCYTAPNQNQILQMTPLNRLL